MYAHAIYLKPIAESNVSESWAVTMETKLKKSGIFYWPHDL